MAYDGEERDYDEDWDKDLTDEEEDELTNTPPSTRGFDED